MKTVVVSGGFDPIHIGHVRMLQEARALGDKLIVVLNNDAWLCTKKGYAFMPQEERAEIIAAFSFVDEVMISVHEENDADRSVRRELEMIRPHVFANGGDRKDASDIPEAEICEKYNIEMIFNVGAGGKVQSSSWLTGKLRELS
jgi:cytidyltransferase-like protein